MNITFDYQGILQNRIITTICGRRVPLINVTSYGIDTQTRKVYINMSDKQTIDLNTSDPVALVARLDQCFIDYV